MHRITVLLRCDTLRVVLGSTAEQYQNEGGRLTCYIIAVIRRKRRDRDVRTSFRLLNCLLLALVSPSTNQSADLRQKKIELRGMKGAPCDKCGERSAKVIAPREKCTDRVGKECGAQPW
jgi:hypothetical protein